MTINQGTGELVDANMVAITFEYQKNEKRNKTVHIFKTGDNTMCPVLAWATTVRRLRRTIPGVNGKTTVCSNIENGIVRQIDSHYARLQIKSIVEIIEDNSIRVH